MTKLYKKSEITFAIVWIIAYVVLTSIADSLSEGTGVEKSVTVIVHLVMTAVLFLWIRKNGLTVKYGLCRSKVPAKRFLYYLPLAIIASASLWNGFNLNYGGLGTVCFIVSMCCVGFLEEVIFRGLLFRAMEKNNLKRAIIVSSVTFGIGHIVNLFRNGSLETFVQIIFAVLVGFVLVLIFHFGGSLIPCIIFHAANNALSAFENAGKMDPRTELVLNFVLIVVVLGGYLLYIYKVFCKKDRAVK